MRISQSFFRTEREAQSDAVAISDKLLYRGGFVRRVATGRYALLPLGKRVHQKVMQIIREEMAAVGSEEMEIPIMQPVEVWQVTNRQAAFGDQMITAQDHYGHNYVLSATGEAMMTEIFGGMRPSYKDLPINVYQFLYKFRDEVRPRGGLIRAREFLMKDAYNFERTEQEFMETYKKFWIAYDRIFRRLGLETIPVIAENGALGGDYSHEFMLLTEDQVQGLDAYWDETEKAGAMTSIDVTKNDAEYKRILRIYLQTPERTLKNLIYRIDENEFVCVVIRGDYKIDFVKLRRLLKYQRIRPATMDEISKLGSCIGYVSAIGLDAKKVRILVDESVRHNKNYWDGAHQEKVFRQNVDYERDIKPIVHETVDVHENKVFNAGADKIVMCDRCGYKANVEKAQFVRDQVNMDQKIQEFKTIDQPEWVCTMDENVEHYKLPKSHFLKNVVFKDRKGRIIIAVVRGDIEANDVKISRLLDCGPLVPADDDDLSDIGTKSGWVHSWGHDKGRDDVIYVGDSALEQSRNLIGGQKEKTTDSYNVNYNRDFKVTKIGDIASAYDGAKCAHCKEGYLREKKAMEMGHIFKYDDYYSTPHKAYFVDQDGKGKPMWMGAYGIGIGRAVAAVVEMSHDDRGIIWPKSIAPYHIHVIELGGNVDAVAADVRKMATSIYDELTKRGWDVLWDDRDDVSAGVKFADADLVGIPVRVVVSARTQEEHSVEVKLRTDKDSTLVQAGDTAIEKIEEMLKKLDDREAKFVSVKTKVEL